MGTQIKSIMMENEGSKLLLEMQRNIAKFIIEHQDEALKEEDLMEAQLFYEETVGVILTLEQTKQVINSSGYAKANLIAYTTNDTEAASALLNALCKLVLGCPSPTYSDDIDSELFLIILRREAKLLFS